MSISSKLAKHVGLRLGLIGLAAGVVVLSGCAFDPQGGYRPVVQVAGEQKPPISFKEANTQCWAVSMNIAGFGATIPQLEAYRTCMMRNAWEDHRSLF